MLVKFKVSDNCELEADVKDMVQAFQFIAYAGSLFSTGQCGNCSSEDLKLDHRTPQGFDYYSIVCNDCKHELKFGQAKETGHLFPKGWEPGYDSGDSGSADDTYQGGTGETESAPQEQAAF